MKKVLSLVLALMMVFCFTAVFTGCGGSDEGSSDDGAYKVGFICLHDENSTYDKNFIDAANKAAEDLGVEAIIKTNIPEGQECYDAAAELVDAGCGIIFADSFGHEDYMIQAAT
ncbi:MAG: BMP family ABC transporter substrate-binding protein, partial [Clostridia bacterium]|nr:BMP family ABC transporter substrate-binding protein [Clostridia bacterium]